MIIMERKDFYADGIGFCDWAMAAGFSPGEKVRIEERYIKLWMRVG
jgi:hypothetical protein